MPERDTQLRERIQAVSQLLTDLGDYNEGEVCWCSVEWWEEHPETDAHSRLCKRARDALTTLDELLARLEAVKREYENLLSILRLANKNTQRRGERIKTLERERDTMREALSHVLDEALERWHESPEEARPRTAHEWMGLTWEQYAAYAENRIDDLAEALSAAAPPNEEPKE